MGLLEFFMEFFGQINHSTHLVGVAGGGDGGVEIGRESTTLKPFDEYMFNWLRRLFICCVHTSGKGFVRAITITDL